MQRVMARRRSLQKAQLKDSVDLVGEGRDREDEEEQKKREQAEEQVDHQSSCSS